MGSSRAKYKKKIQTFGRFEPADSAPVINRHTCTSTIDGLLRVQEIYV